MEEVTLKIAELTKERDVLLEDKARLEKQQKGYEMNLKIMLRQLEECSITLNAHHRTALLYSNTRDWLIFSRNSAAKQVTDINIKIKLLDSRIIRLRMEDENREREK